MDVGRKEAPGIRVVYYVDDIVVYGETEHGATNHMTRWRARLEATWIHLVYPNEKVKVNVQERVWRGGPPVRHNALRTEKRWRGCCRGGHQRCAPATICTGMA